MRKLKEGQRRALEKVVESGITEGFYLAGGIALMIRHNHRWSKDFDFFSYPYKLIARPRLWKRISIRVARDRDIAAMKSVAIMQRGSKKDFYDLYFLMNHHGWKLNDIIHFARAKYGNLFDENSFLKALIYFEDAEVENYPDIEPLWSRVKDFFIESVGKYVKGI